MAEISVRLCDPVLVSASVTGETRWGVHQFPAMSRMPDGGLLLMFADAEDRHETHGWPAPSFVSYDEGESWLPMNDEPRPIRPHYAVSEIFDGDYLVVPASRYLDIEKDGIRLPEPAAVGDTYGTRYTYRVSDMPPAIQDYFRYLPARRWSPGSGVWEDGVVEYDMDGLLAMRRERSTVLPRTFFERPLVRHKGELLYADYRGLHAREDGSVPAKGTSTLMVSTDNGRSFQRRSIIAMDPSDNDLMGEPHLSPTVDGRLVCVIRRTDQDQKPMCVTWSADSGRTWTPVKDLFEFGVWPCVLLLGNGTMVLSYGRPGVHMAFDPNGTGESWTKQVAVIEGDPAEKSKHTCGYTSLMPLDDDSFLIAYSDFLYADERGAQCKAILTRRVQAVTVD
ncbi:MAG: glycoside hydrolase [Candidatus Pacebacteria bacterium]|nr:glycoside hydrolase [Candidatus Paceibacterota bacterium]